MPIELAQHCKFCDSDQLEVFTGKERMFSTLEEFQYLECLDCGSVQIAQIPADLSPYYSNSTYYSFQTLNISSTIRKFLKNFRMKFFLATGIASPIYGYWLRKLNLSADASIADVGCGNGQLIYELYASGFSNLHGFDPFLEKDQVVNSQVHLWKKTIEQSDLKFDLIMMHHAFEHMEDGESILKSCLSKLNPGGQLLIRTPVTNSKIWKEKRELWVQLDAPRHLIIPSIAGFEALCQRVGCKVNEILFDSDEFQFWGTALYEKGLSLDKSLISREFSKLELKEMHKKALQFNSEGKGDQVCFFISKA